MNNGVCSNCGDRAELLNGLCCDCHRLEMECQGDQAFHLGETSDGLEQVFCQGHQYHNRIFYDTREGELLRPWG